MLCVIAQNGSKQLYLVAFNMLDSENNNSWMYFLLKQRECIGVVENLVFIFYQYQSIATVLVVVFSRAHYGACIQYIEINIIVKFHTYHCHEEYFLAAKVYCIFEFYHHFDKIKINDPAIADYFEGIGIEKWSRAYFQGFHYNIRPSNVVESFNSKTKNA